MPKPRPPAEHYEWLGRITAAAALLEVQLGMCGWTALHGKRWTEDWTEVAGAPGAAVRLCVKALPSLPAELGRRLEDLLADARTLRSERHRLNHSALVFDPTASIETAPWLLRDVRGLERPLLIEEEGRRLTADLHALSGRAADLRRDIYDTAASDTYRT